jgi:N,N-dimethylformamidase
VADRPFLVGYPDRFSAAPGERLSVMASSDVLRTANAALVRLGPGDVTGSAREEVVQLLGQVQVQPQQTRTGSFMSAAGTERNWPKGPFVAVLLAMPTRLGYRATLTSQTTSGRSWALGVDVEGRLTARAETSGTSARAVTDVPLQCGAWYLLAAGFDPDEGITLVQEPIGRAASWRTARSGAVRPTTVKALGRLPFDGLLNAPVVIAGIEDQRKGEMEGCYDGKVELPQLVSGRLNDDLLGRLRQGRPLGDELLVGWDFTARLSATGTSGITVPCVGTDGCDGTLWNTPTEAVTGHAWDGREQDFRLAPAHYGAIHFHVDDLDDCRWQPAVEVDLPDTLASRAYAVRLSTENGLVERVPFYVRSPLPQAPLLFLTPTASYLAYGNDHPATDGSFSEATAGGTPVIYADDLLMHEHREWGLSCYDSHRDGSGVSITTGLRPLVNMRPTHRYHVGPWQLAADLALLGWMDDNAVSYDVATDEDLHREGHELLAPYRAVVTGTHPEYYSTAMLDSVESYLDGGGRLAYLGANGFYWRVAFDPARPGVMEIRRGQGGSRAWESPPGEGHLAFSGERCGLWRHLGRAPQKLTGSGYSAQGFDRSGWYRRLPDSFDPRVAFLFEGVDSGTFGTSGAIGGGAVGQELDRYDRDLGTPQDALLLATSEGLTESYQRCVEEVLFTIPGTNALNDPHVRADVVYHVKPGGGAVFAAGSIAWTGALGLDRNVSRITRNVLARFVDPAPLPW